jgi:excisionase family DNA binding protein
VVQGEPKLLSTGEAASMIGCTPQHLRLLIRTGRLKGTRVGRAWVVRDSDLREFQTLRLKRHLLRGRQSRSLSLASASMRTSQ